jgi:hypothetical protein
MAIPYYLYAVVFSSLSIIVGLIWDISWHLSIGRDGLFSPPHLGMYLGAVVSGTFSGFQVLKTSFAGTLTEKAQKVKFWGIFYSSLGALFCIWGAFAMLTSAPFDDWWHNTYGLDVQILSPPHTVLLLGMMTIQFGAIIAVLAIQNRQVPESIAAETPQRALWLRIMYITASGFFLTTLFVLGSEYLSRHDMHHSLFYQISCGAFPFLLVAVARSSGLAITGWILQLFPAEPKLGPILNPITHYQMFRFPLLLVIPALSIDWLLHRYQRSNEWLLAVMIGSAFLLLHLAVHWPMGDFLMSPYARNWFFGSDSWYFGSSPDWQYRYDFMPWHTHTGWPLVKGLAIAWGIGIVSTRLGLKWGKWMQKVQR